MEQKSSNAEENREGEERKTEEILCVSFLCFSIFLCVQEPLAGCTPMAVAFRWEVCEHDGGVDQHADP